MKLLDNEKLLNASEGLSLEEIYALGRKAHFECRVEEGNAYFRQLRPEHGEIYIRANGFLSQLLCFSSNYDLALAIAQEVERQCPSDYSAIHYLQLVHCYRQEYEIAWQLHSSVEPSAKDEGGHAYQSACLLSALGRYAEAMLELERSLAGADARYRYKLWDDPELAHLWKALPELAQGSEVGELLMRPFWGDLLESYNPELPFVELDPGNLNSFSADEMKLVGLMDRGPSARIIVEEAVLSPVVFVNLMERLMSQRASAWGALKIALMFVRCKAWRAQQGAN